MTLVPAQCTKCGAALTLNPTEEAAICPYCNTPFIVQKAINSYTQNNTINAAVVNIFGGQTDFVIRGGRLERYNGSSTEVIIPNNVNIIGAEAFEGCAGIKKIIIPGSVYSIEGRGALDRDIDKLSKSLSNSPYRCTSIEFLEGIEEIGDFAFDELSSYLTVILPRSLQRIRRFAFSNCFNLKSIRIPDSVKEIGMSAFSGCRNVDVFYLPDNIETIEIDSFSFCEGLSHFKIPENVKKIERGAFSYCKNLQDINIPNSVKKIEDKAFFNCKNLRSVTFGNSLEELGEEAFYGCSSLENIEIPSSVKVIGREAFNECSSLKNVSINSSDISIGKQAFRNYWKNQGLCWNCGGKTSIFGNCKEHCLI